MLFNSLQFLLFFIVVTILYYKLPHAHRWKLLLVASCYFYMIFMPIYILILGFTIVVDYWAGICIENSKNEKKRLYLIASLVANIGVLAFFKYWNFLNDNISLVLHKLSISNPVPYTSILLPIGLSFHTFQAMSYTIEVYRGKQKAEKHFGLYSLYVLFYPQLVAGPIERPQNVLPQFYEVKKWNWERVKEGILLMSFGFFKKVVIADRLAIVVGDAYSNPNHSNGLTLLLATLFFTIQIYCDFSGYSDIAIGSAKVMGFKLMDNFKTPYFSKNISDFWNRWHISLSTWFKDYLYIPLGGNRVAEWHWYINILVVFIVSGFWHGANYTFLVWGALHGFYLVIYNVFKKYIKVTIPDILGVIVTFFLASFAWIFFRANNLSDAILIIKEIGESSYKQHLLTSMNWNEIVFSFILIVLLFCKEKWLYTLPSKNNTLFYSFVFTMVTLCYFFGEFTLNQFIYFQF